MPTDADWTAAYDHLLQSVRDRADSSLVLELQRAPATRVVDDLSQAQMTFPGEDRLRREMLRKDLDSARTRAPTPEEAFRTSVTVLVARLKELPAISLRLEELLERAPEAIAWMPDASEREFRREEDTFTASDFSLTPGEREQIDSALNRLLKLMEE
jgi:hypothetical protein